MRARRTLVAAMAATTGLAVAVALTAGPTAAAPPDEDKQGPKGLLTEYAADTWRSFDAMVHDENGLPDDNIGGSLAPDTRGGYTSPTNIGAYLWSTVAARDIGLIGADEARERMAQTLDTVAQMEQHEPSGMYYNWYDPATGEKLETFPSSGDTIKQFLSSVDNGWLATGLLLTSRAEPACAVPALVMSRLVRRFSAL